ncbi:MAG: NADH-quinone oxidoreductase subunit H [Verrucomicrobia bacterium ADurb.Bin006]|nr:MAG: NADH-quinone oxidoreductase subunit H [Verrucomicrobia bacterium ADurb.Bin006]
MIAGVPPSAATMFEALDQLFVSLKHWLVGQLPPAWQSWVSLAISAAAILGVFMTLFALTVLIERKGLGRIQNRYGPNRVGPWGLLQPIADLIKMLTKEDLVPSGADRVVHFVAPVVMVVPVLMAYAVIPIGRNMAAVDFNAGLLFFFAVGACIELAVFMAGWSSRNKYSLLGGMRAIAQMISYELPLILSTLPVVMLAGSLSLVDITDAQAGHSGGWLARWHVFTPWGLAGLLLFTVAATAESNRAPFDLPEGESEIIAGHLVEYSGIKYALFFIGEYLGMFAVSALGITLFLGGWRAPVIWLEWVPSYMWFFLKLGGFVALFIWLRGTLPRLRADHLMNLAWKFLLPLVLLNAVSAALWHYTAPWTFVGAGLARWLLCGSLVGVPYVLLGRRLFAGQHIGPRTYRMAA